MNKVLGWITDFFMTKEMSGAEKLGASLGENFLSKIKAGESLIDCMKIFNGKAEAGSLRETAIIKFLILSPRPTSEDEVNSFLLMIK